MATGTTNPMTYTNVTSHINLTDRNAADQHPIDSITGLRAELIELRGQCGDALKEALRSFIASYQDEAVSQDTITEINGRLDQITAVIETWDTENEDSTLEKVIKDVSDLQLKVGDLPALLIGLSESNLSAAKAVESMTTDLADFRTRLDELTSTGSASADGLTDVTNRLVTAEADILNLKGADTEQAGLLVQLDQAIKQYLPTANGDGEIKQTTDLLQSTIPTELVISKTDAAEEPVEPASEEPSGDEPVEEINTNSYLDYTLTFNNSTGEQKFSANLDLTSDVNSYLAYVFAQFVSQHNTLTPTEAGLNSRLSFVEGRLSNLTQYVAHMANYHNFIIKDIYFYFANDIDGTDPTALKYLPAPIDPTPEENLDIQADFVNIIPAFSNTARMDDKVFSPSELVGKNFYVIFETSYPIDLSSDKVSLGFPDFQETSVIYAAPGNFKCARLGIPDLSHATYVLYADINEETKKLTPFTFGSGTFGSNFTEEGTYKFMLKVTDPYNPNTTALKTKQITIGYPIYRGISMAAILPVEGLTLDTFALQHTELNSPATTIDWTDYNADDSAKYYYYLVPSTLLTGSTLVFNTGYGPGGWETQESQIKINNIDYTVFRTSYKLTYCPSTMVTVKNV
jgi:hypothetical protein